MSKYENIKQIGEGTFGKVYKSRDNETGEFVAIKKTVIDPESGFSFTTIREIKMLRKLQSKCILSLKDIYMEDNSVNLVLEYMSYDLTGLLASKYKFSDNQIHSMIYQMIEGIGYMHSQGLVHRDLKPSNILLDSAGHLKIADFGLAREVSSRMTNRVCTLWYRAPELLLGDVKYTNRVDSWSIGCIILEFKSGGPYFKGRDEITQVDEIFKKMGSPSVEYPWEGLFEIKKYKKEESWDEIITDNFGDLYKGEVLQLLSELLRLDKNKRISLANASELPVVRLGARKLYPLDFPDSHEFSTKGRRSED